MLRTDIPEVEESLDLPRPSLERQDTIPFVDEDIPEELEEDDWIGGDEEPSQDIKPIEKKETLIEKVEIDVSQTTETLHKLLITLCYNRD